MPPQNLDHVNRNSELPDMLAEAVERGLRRVLADEKLRDEFWRAGYEELEKHAGTNVAQWIGRRLLNIVITALVAGVLAWAVMTGQHK